MKTVGNEMVAGVDEENRFRARMLARRNDFADTQ